MRVIVYGAGAVGGAIGGRLAQHGHDTVLIARGAHLEAMQRDGLELITPDERERIAVQAVGHPSEIAFRTDDVVLLAMKSQDTTAALDDLAAATDLQLPIVCAQNGVANERMAARRFERVYGTLVWLPANFLEPGQVTLYSAPCNGLLDTGCYPTGTDDVVEQLTKALASSRYAARPQPRIMEWKVHKLLSNVMNACTALFGFGADLGDLHARIRAETETVLRAAGIAWTDEDDARARREEAAVSIRPIDGQPRLGGSSWQSLVRESGSIESDYLNGEIVLLGKQAGIPTPYNRALQLAANRAARNRHAPGDLTPADLENLIAQLG